MRIFGLGLAALTLAWTGVASADTRFIQHGQSLMDGPGKIYRHVTGLPSGTKVDLIEVYEGWGLVRLPSGMTGWTRAAGLARSYQPAPVVPEDVDRYSTVVWPPTGNLNLRAGPGTDHAVLMVMPRGDMVEVFQKAGKWAHVRCITGETGWTYAAYLTR